MKVYALIGKSGTGKSYQAMTLCGKKSIPGIIDDGLFIYDNKIMEGKSAKREETKIGAIKAALFIKEEQREAMIATIKKINPESILVLGTSNGMVEKIVETLKLPSISEKIFIEDITTDEQREIAKKQRNDLGKHVIPVSTGVLKKEFSGYFLHPIRMIRGFGFTRETLPEKTVVRPTYSYMGEFFISDKVITDLIYWIGNKNKNIERIVKLDIDNKDFGMKIMLSIILKKGVRVVESSEKFQKEIKDKIETMTAFHIYEVNIEVQDIAV